MENKNISVNQRSSVVKTKSMENKNISVNQRSSVVKNKEYGK